MVADDDDDEDEEEELVDPMEALREQCSKDAHSLALLDELAKCTERVESRTMTEETCTQVKMVLDENSQWDVNNFTNSIIQELFDFIGHRDHCVAHHLFNHLK